MIGTPCMIGTSEILFVVYDIDTDRYLVEGSNMVPYEWAPNSDYPPIVLYGSTIRGFTVCEGDSPNVVCFVVNYCDSDEPIIDCMVPYDLSDFHHVSYS